MANIEQLRGSLAGLLAEQIWLCRHRLRTGLGDRHRAEWPAPPTPRRCVRRSGLVGCSPKIADTVPKVLYGGSVNAKNVGDIVG